MKWIKIGEREKDILRIIGILGIISIAAVAPNALLLLKGVTRKQRFYNQRNLKTRINKLAEKDVIYLSGDKIKLTTHGKELVKIIQIEDINKIPRPDRWDGLWRLISYDIPNYKKKEREYFRNKLKELGFSRVQESLCAFPFDCQEEIAVIAQNLGISPFIIYLTTDHLPNQKKLIRKYKLIK